MSSFDLRTFYEPPPGHVERYSSGSGPVAVIWARKSEAPADSPLKVAVKKIAAYSSLKKLIALEENRRILLALQHENIVKVLHIIWQNRRISDSFLVMEACDGNLEDFLAKREGGLGQLRTLGKQIATGLSYLHEKEIAHRNISPAGILIDRFEGPSQAVKLAGLSCLRFIGSEMKETSNVWMGSSGYQAPEVEQALLRGILCVPGSGKRADVFSAGVVFFQILKGRTLMSPFPFLSLSILSNIDEFLTQNDVGDDEDCLLLMHNMLALDPAKRATASEVLQHVFFEGFDVHKLYNEPSDLSHVSDDCIGKGAYSKTFAWLSKPETTECFPSQVAVKYITGVTKYKMKGTVIVEGDKKTLLSFRHKNIVRIWQVSTSKELKVPIIVMERLQGNLKQFVGKHKCGFKELCFLGHQIVSGMHYLHEKEIAHRDVKLANVLVDSLESITPRLKLADFGCSKQAKKNDVQMATARERGTSEYWSPDMVHAWKNDEKEAHIDILKADIFAAGVMFFQILKGMDEKGEPLVPFSKDHRLDSTFKLASFLDLRIENVICRDLLSEMLAWDAPKRANARQVLDHYFFMPMRVVEQRKRTKGISKDAIASTLSELSKKGSAYNEVYEVERRIQESGTFGTVFRYALRDRFKRIMYLPEKIAVKVLNEKANKSSLPWEGFVHEEVDNIIDLYGVEAIFTGRTVIKMELARANLNNLKEKLNTEKYLPFEFTYLAHQVMNGLMYLHDKSIAHRGMKPQNVLVTWEEENARPRLYSVTLKLSDFGMDNFFPDEEVNKALLVENRAYMAPEVAKKGEALPDYKAADVFSAGIVLFEMLNGEVPFTLDQLSSDENVEVFEGTKEKHLRVLGRMLKWDIQERYTASKASRRLARLKRPKATTADMMGADVRGLTALHTAARDGDLEVAKWLIESGTNVDQATKAGFTPLHFACQKGHLPIAAALIDVGAKVNALNEGNKTPLLLACNSHKVDRSANKQVVQLLIRSEAKVNAADGVTSPLHLACSNELLDIADLLLESGANKLALNEDGCTPKELIRGNDERKFKKLFRKDYSTGE